MLLIIPQCTGQSLKRIYSPKISIVPRLRRAALNWHLTLNLIQIESWEAPKENIFSNTYFRYIQGVEPGTTENSRQGVPCRDQIQGLIKEYSSTPGQETLAMSDRGNFKLQISNNFLFQFPKWDCLLWLPWPCLTTTSRKWGQGKGRGRPDNLVILLPVFLDQRSNVWVWCWDDMYHLELKALKDWDFGLSCLKRG